MGVEQPRGARDLPAGRLLELARDVGQRGDAILLQLERGEAGEKFVGRAAGQERFHAGVERALQLAQT